MHHLTRRQSLSMVASIRLTLKTATLKTIDWLLQDGEDIDEISPLNAQVHAVGLMVGENSG